MIEPILQDEISECGLACIAMIVNASGGETSLFELRRKYQVSKDGLSMFQLIKIFDEFNIGTVALSGEVNQLKDIKAPSVLFWNKSHFVVLEKADDKSITVVDPAMGRKTYSLEEAKFYFSGVALEIIDTDSISVKSNSDKSTKHTSPFSFLKIINSSSWLYGNMVLIFLLAAGIGLFSLASPKLFSLTIDEVVTKNDQELLSLLLYLFSLLFVLLLSFRYFRARLNITIRKVVENDISSSFISYMVKLPLGFFEKRTSASLLRKVQALDLLHTKFTSGWVDIITDAAFAVVFMSLMTLINTKLAMFSIAVCAVFVIFRLLLIIKIEKHQKEAIDTEIERNAVLLSIVDEMKINKLYGNNAKKVADWSAVQSKSVDVKAKLTHIQDMNSVVFDGISNTQSLAISSLGALAILNGDNSIGDIFSFVLYKDLFLDSALRIIDRYMSLRIVNIELDRLDDILAVNPEFEGNNKMICHEHKPIKSIDIEKVCFSYGTFEDYILKDVSLSIKSGEHVSIVGKSGGGKSTLMSVISSLYEPTEGRVLINNESLREYGVDNYRGRISLVTAHDDILVGSVLDNIAMSDFNSNIERVIECLKDVGLYEEVMNLPAGLYTRIGHGGMMLSSGQIQRLMLARALYREPDLLILDEPTSHLNNELKSKIMELLSKKKYAILSVTHDMDICNYANKVYELKSGSLSDVSHKFHN